MRTACPNCDKQLIIPDEKIPSGAALKVACPECRHPLSISAKRPAGGENKAQPSKQTPADAPPEPDFFPPGALVSLLVLRDAAWSEPLETVFKELGYHVTIINDPSQAVSKLYVNNYHAIILEDEPWSQDVMARIHSWPGTKRRVTCVFLVGDKAASLHPGASFRKGVDAYFHAQDHLRARDLIQAAMKEYDSACQAWRAAAKKLGKEA